MQKTTLEINLREQIEFSDQTFTSLTLREPTAGQMAEADKAGAAHDVNIRLISLVAGVPDGVVRRLPATEYRQALTFFTGFTNPARPTGGGSSGA